MPEIKLTNVTKRWGKFYAVDHLDLDIADNAFITLLGPSGCGKTTTLRMIAGLETPTSGQIKIGDRVVFDSDAGINVPANKRKVGFLFQNYALWPNMTVYQNIAFGLGNKKEEMPLVNSEAMELKSLIEALKDGQKIKELVGECYDKGGKLDMDKVYLKFIDTYIMSIYGAKKLFGFKIHEAPDPDQAAMAKSGELKKELETVETGLRERGYGLNEKCELTKGGQVASEVRKLTKEEIDLAVRRVSRIVKIGMFMDRYPAELSGGQQQRVAIARTLAPEPQVMFMDEPLSNLDAKLRLEMRYELQRLHVETGSTFVYVTHDQMEAMTLATRICLINNGVLQQYDAPLTVYNRPNNLFVADFVGNPSINFVDAKGSQGSDGSISLSLLNGRSARFIPKEPLNMEEWFSDRDRAEEELKRKSASAMADKKNVEKGNKDEVFKYHIAKVNEDDFSIQEEPEITNEDFVLGIRPERLKIMEGSKNGPDEGASKDHRGGKLDAEVYGAMPTGMESTIKLRIDDFLLTGVVFGDTTFEIGKSVSFDIAGNDIFLFDRRSGRFIASGAVEIQ
ncbi:MAG: ABC transporter ATP-binding protein [Lachnospiraceae bacterium]|nr:ABC transporter ATP-binding protein [Lachnospiraceae bacterium]